MPSTVRSILQAAGLQPGEVVSWGTRPADHSPGVYIVAVAEDPDVARGTDIPPLDRARLVELLAVRQELTVDGARADVDTLYRRLASMWVPNETVLYIGRASTSISDRVKDYYSTPLGARAPHSGGWPIKTLRDLDRLFVHVAPAADPTSAETAMIDAFVADVTAADRDRLVDPALPLPFANLEDGRRRRKKHGIGGARAPRLAGAPRTSRPPTSSPQTAVGAANPAAGAFTLTVTQKDVEKGQIRVTRSAKRLIDFPERAVDVQVYLRGQPVTCTWDARMGPDKERSGLLRVGREALSKLVPAAPTQLALRVAAEGVVHLE